MIDLIGFFFLLVSKSADTFLDLTIVFHVLFRSSVRISTWINIPLCWECKKTSESKPNPISTRYEFRRDKLRMEQLFLDAFAYLENNLIGVKVVARLPSRSPLEA